MPIALSGAVEKATANLTKQGIGIGFDTCISRDQAGEVADPDTAWDDLPILVRQVVLDRGHLSEDRDFQRRWMKVMGVGICSLKKSLDY